MRETADLIVAIFAEAARLVVIRNYAVIFWERKASRIFAILMYGASFLMTTTAYLFFHEIIINLIVTFAGIFLISLAYKSGILRKFVCSAITLAVSVILDFISALLLMDNPSSGNYELASSFISVFLFFLSSVIAGKIFKRRKEELFLSQWWLIFVITIGSICVAYALSQDRVASRWTVICVCMVLFIINYIVYNLFASIQEYSEKESEMDALRSQMDIYENQISASIKRDEAVRIMRHDMKHHVNELYHLAEEGNDEAIKEYILRMGGEIHSADVKVSCGVAAIDGVMGYMLERAEEKGIFVKTHITVPESIELSSYDMNILLGNLMQNAIDAAEKCEDKHIAVLIKYDRSCIFIKISNSFSGELIVKNGEYLTTKDSPKEHGLGIRSARNVVERGGGSIGFAAEGQEFFVKIMIPVV